MRILILVSLITTALAITVHRYLPDLEFDWGRAVALSFVGFLGYFGLVAVTLWFVPPIIQIADKGIVRQQGRSQSCRLRCDIRCITVDSSEPSKPILRVESTKKPFAAGLSSKVTPAELARLLRETFPELLVEEHQ